MPAVIPVEVVIIGGGPAGVAAALHIARKTPELAAEMRIIEAARYPRPKICGGGVTFHGEEQLHRLDIQLDLPAVTIQNLIFRLADRTFETPSQAGMRIVQRAEFDAALARTAAARKIKLHEGERLLDLVREGDGVRLTTSRGQYRARVVVAADGANSTVRRKLALRSSVGVARLLRVVRPADPANSDVWRRRAALFDFSCVAEGIQGYMWDFPSTIDGRPHVNHGIFDSRLESQSRDPLPHGHLKRVFARYLRQRDVDIAAARLQGHPVRWFNPQAAFTQPHVLLAGDAAGVDPLFAEGISYAMEYGVVVADAVADAFARNDFSFADYRARLLNHRLGHSLRRRSVVARHLYRFRHPWLWSWLWRAAAVAPSAFNQTVGAALDVLPPVGRSPIPLTPSAKDTNRELAVRPDLSPVRPPGGEL